MKILSIYSFDDKLGAAKVKRGTRYTLAVGPALKYHLRESERGMVFVYYKNVVYRICPYPYLPVYVKG